MASHGSPVIRLIDPVGLFYPMKFSIYYLLSLTAAFCIMLGCARWNLLLAVGTCPFTFGLAAAVASSPNLPARGYGLLQSILWSTYTVFLATPFFLMLYFGNMEFFGIVLLLGVAAVTSTLTGRGGPKLSDRNSAFKDSSNSQG